MPQLEIIILAHWEGKKKQKKQTTRKRPSVPNGQSAPACETHF